MFHMAETKRSLYHNCYANTLPSLGQSQCVKDSVPRRPRPLALVMATAVGGHDIGMLASSVLLAHAIATAVGGHGVAAAVTATGHGRGHGR